MKKHEKSAIFDFILVIILLIFIGLAVLMKIDNSIYKTRDERSLEDFHSSWRTCSGKDISLDDLGKKAAKNEEGELEINIYHTIPSYLVNDTILNFRSKNIRFKAIIGDEVVYSFMAEDQRVLSKGNGSTFHRINIKTEDAGKDIELQVFPIYKDSSSRITSAYLGRTWDYFGMILDQNFFGFQFSIMIVLIGVLLIIMSFFSRFGGGHNERNRILGILIICVGTWAISETLMPQFMFGHSTQLNEINHILLVFMPYFFISYVYLDLEYCRDSLLKISFVITVVELILICVLSLTGIKDTHESLNIIHAGFVLNVAIAVFAIVENILYCKKNKIKYNALTIIFSLGVFMASVAWDVFYYYWKYDVRDRGAIMRIGILLGVLILAIDSIGKLFEGIKAAEINSRMSKITYTDALTGLANRNAYEVKEKEIQEKLDKGEIKELLVCKFDINDLRKINDNYGHAYGDRHIIKCAEIINDAFGNSGHAFRVDCDEFVVFIIGDGTEYIYERGILKLVELEREFNRTPGLLTPLHIAYGHVIFDKDLFESIEKAEVGADKKMYECKERMKKGAIV